MGDAAEGSRFCHIILDCLEKVMPGLSLELANFYFCLGEMYSERAEARSTSQVLAKRYRKQVRCPLFTLLTSLKNINNCTFIEPLE
jgi:SET and MYND domain-containing protein